MKKVRYWLILAAFLLLLAACAQKHTHTPAAQWEMDDTHHWYPCAGCDEGELNKEAHAFDNACDAACNACGYERTPSEHVYDNACDGDCNVCKQKRIPTAHQFDNVDDLECNVCGYARQPGEHIYDHDCDPDCNLCGDVRVPADHVYDNACDATCNVCQAERETAGHVYDHGCDTDCNECGAVRTPEDHKLSEEYVKNKNEHWRQCLVCGYTTEHVAHSFDKEYAEARFLKSDGTDTQKAVYYKSCVCGTKGTETFESDKKPANLVITSNIGKVYDGAPVNAPSYTHDSIGLVKIHYKPKGADDIWYTTEAPTEAGSYVVRVTVAISKGYAGDRATMNFTISRHALTEVKLSKIYDGLAVLGPVKLTTKDCVGLTEGDELIVTLLLDKCDVGAKVIKVIGHEGADSKNYTLSIADVVAKVKPRPLKGTISVKAPYNGYRTFTHAVGTGNDRVEKDTLILEVLADTRYPGKQEILEVSLSPNQRHNYTVKKSQVKLEVLKKEITVRLPDTVQKEADGTDIVEYEIPYGYLCAGDKAKITFRIPSAEAGTYNKVKITELTCSNPNYTVKISNKTVNVLVYEPMAE